jgi:pyruvate formate lyase activating enzyme
MQSGTIFDIQHYSVYDGPGIRTVVFLKGCPLRCAWCQNPESQMMKPEIGYLKAKCTGCGKCVEACPNEAIKQEVKPEAEKLLSKCKNTLSFRKNPSANRALNNASKGIICNRSICTVCGRCAVVCETGAAQLIGSEICPDDVIEKVLMDKPFYDNSGGGVTFSGGEPTLQNAFLLDMLGTSKDAGIHTAIETCGYFDESLIDELLPLTDLFLFDLKQIDAVKHKAFTGKENGKILSNFISILNRAGAERIIPRIPLIPGFNTDKESIEAFSAFLNKQDFYGEINIMPYNYLYKSKFEKIGRSSEYIEFGKLDEDRTKQTAGLFALHGLRAVCQK